MRVLGQSGLGIFVGIILARLLSPEDFGVVAIAMVFIGFSDMVASVGLAVTIVQRKDLSDLHIRVGFTLGLIIATCFMALFWVFADVAAAFFNEPRVTELIQVLAFGAWVSTASSVHRGLLMRHMNFKKLAQIDFVGYALGTALVSCVLAFMGYGVWSLVIGTMVWQILAGIWLVLSVKVDMRPHLRLQEVKDLLFFSFGISLNNTIGYLSNKSTDTIIGRFLDSVALGLYNRASTTAHIPFLKIATTISSVMLSSYSRSQNDTEELRRKYYKAIRLVSSLSLPILAGLFVCGEYVITGMYGEKWRAAVEVFQILCIAGMFNNVLHLAGAVVQAVGKIYQEVMRQFINTVLTILMMIFAAQYGLEAVAWACVLSAMFLYLMMAQLSLSIVEGTWKEYFLAQLPAFSISVPVMVVDYAVVQALHMQDAISNELGLLILIGFSAVTYLACLAFLPDRAIGGVREWVFSNYGSRLPKVVQRYYCY